MELFKTKKTINFLKYKRACLILSGIAILVSLAIIFVYPKPNFGIDFSGGTEVQLAFKGDVQSGELRGYLTDLGYGRAEVVPIEGKANEYLIRVREVSSLSEKEASVAQKAVENAFVDAKVFDFKVSPGGDKIALRASRELALPELEKALLSGGVKVRNVAPFGQKGDFRYEAYLIGIADKLVDSLGKKLGSRGPEAPKRVEWVGPKAGRELRDAALKSLLYAIGLIFLYVALRFDLRFAPGGIVALLHDAIITVGILTLLRREVTLTTIAAVLTIIGYSINDTIVIFDRVRENLHRMTNSSLTHVMNVSLTQTLSRTILTSSVTMLSMVAFFFVGTPVIKDLALTLFIGFVAGTYSTIYIASPVTDWMDRRFFRRA